MLPAMSQARISVPASMLVKAKWCSRGPEPEKNTMSCGLPLRCRNTNSRSSVPSGEMYSDSRKPMLIQNSQAFCTSGTSS